MHKYHSTALTNKGTAFSHAERTKLGILGQLPHKVETLEEQVQRAYIQYSAYDSDLKRNIYLRYLHDHNTVLFYKLVSQHLKQLLPIIYTPVVGVAVRNYSREFRQPQGIYIAYPDQEHIEAILTNSVSPGVQLFVATDGEGVLGIGDQGVGAMDIPVAKLMVYTLCAGIDPAICVPIMLDVGTDNETLLNDPLYLGWRHSRVRGAEYHSFIAAFVAAVKKLFPDTFMHWEDFGFQNARKILETYRHDICTFNDDMQGTAVVTLAALLAAVKHKAEVLEDQQIVILVQEQRAWG
ncbi:MAG: hypothetical protein COC15_05135 [Legionellales bacterium]|nr:MAG: hypothetical protein COC15_05135 [Legionellales bacterium]